MPKVSDLDLHSNIFEWFSTECKLIITWYIDCISVLKHNPKSPLPSSIQPILEMPRERVLWRMPRIWWASLSVRSVGHSPPTNWSRCLSSRIILLKHMPLTSSFRAAKAVFKYMDKIPEIKKWWVIHWELSLFKLIMNFRQNHPHDLWYYTF